MLELTRRRFLTGAAAAATLAAVNSALPTFAMAKEAREAWLAEYTPIFFNQEEWRFLISACDRLIPTDDIGPGALDARVPIFIDKQMESDYGHGRLWYMRGPFRSDFDAVFGYQAQYPPRDIYRDGIKAANAACRQAHGDDFINLDANVQSKFLSALEEGNVNMQPVSGPVFFGQLLINTREGFFADPIYGGNRGMAGWKMVGFPGAQGDYREIIREHNKVINLEPVSIEGRRG